MPLQNFVRASLLVISLLLLAGCMKTDSGGTLSAFRNSETRTIAIQCYRSHEGERVFYGNAVIWSACRALAESRVKPSYGTYSPDKMR